MVDISPRTNLVSRSYLEVGSRFHQLTGDYPSTEEYIQMFDQNNFDVTLSMLAAPSARYNYSNAELHDLQRETSLHLFANYLALKKRYYGSESWVGSDKNLREVIAAYEEGRIKVCRGDVRGGILSDIGVAVKEQGENISFIYLSNSHDDMGDRDKKESLDKFKQTLPLLDSTKVIVSGKPPKVFTRIHIPSGLKGASYRGYHPYSWTFFVFSPLEANTWPSTTKYDRHLYEEIAPGYYVKKTRDQQNIPITILEKQ